MSSKASGLPVAAAILAVGLFCSTSAKAETEVDVGFFYDGLAPYGQWVEHPQYGWAWHPAGVEVGWRPYTDGHWIFTDEFGWYWDSDWEWGWAPFHYGRWAFDDTYGWVWIPGSVWGPAWVTWRTGGGFIGWAPLPPEVVWGEGGRLDYGHYDMTAEAHHHAWVFVEERHFAEPRMHERVIMPARNVTLFGVTQDSTRLSLSNGRIMNRSVEPAQVERITGRPVPVMHVREMDHPASAQTAPASSREVGVFRPVVRPASAGRPAPVPPPRHQPAPQAQTPATPERRRDEAQALEQQQRMDRERHQAAPDPVVQRQHDGEKRAPQSQQERPREKVKEQPAQQQQPQQQQPKPQQNQKAKQKQKAPHEQSRDR